MKLHTIETPVESSGDLKISSFRIATSAKAFKILSSNLYSNKIRAVLRELSCNAYDSHVAANCPEKPFDVMLPSFLNEQLIIRDYGTGLCHDDVMGLYTTYFASTKSDSNDYTGALGLGSKSPFAYTDTFGVTSWYDGVARTYSVFIMDGEPSITLVSTQQSSEPNGVEVTMPIASDDIDDFLYESKYVFSVFKTKPNITGRTCDIPEFNIHSDYGSYRFATHPLYKERAYAIMGNVIYPIKTECLPSALLQQLEIRSGSVFIDFNLGDLDITPSREELSYDDDTIDCIKSATDRLNRSIEVEYASLLDNKTYRAAFAELKSMIRNSNRFRVSNEEIVKLTNDNDFIAWESSLHKLNVAFDVEISTPKCVDGIDIIETKTVSKPADFERVCIRKSNISSSQNTSFVASLSPLDRNLIIFNNDLNGATGLRNAYLQLFTNIESAATKSNKWITSIDVLAYRNQHAKKGVDAIASTFDSSEVVEYKASDLLEQYKQENKSERKTPVRKGSIEVTKIVNGLEETHTFKNYKEFLETADGFVMTRNRSSMVSLSDIQIDRIDAIFDYKIIDSVWLIPREQMIRTKKACDENKSKLICLGGFLESLADKMFDDSTIAESAKIKINEDKSIKRFKSQLNRLEKRSFQYLANVIKSYDEFLCPGEQLSIDINTKKIYDMVIEIKYTSYKDRAKFNQLIDEKADAVINQHTDNINYLKRRYPLLFELIKESWVTETIIDIDLLHYMETIDNGCTN